MKVYPEQRAAANAKPTAGKTEQAERTAADAAFTESQAKLLQRIGLAWKRAESDRMGAWLKLASMVAGYVDGHLAHHGHTKATYTDAVRRVEEQLCPVSGNAKASVSRLLGTYGLSVLMEQETDAEDAKQIMHGLTVSLLKPLVRLIQRDATAPALAYLWREPAAVKGPVIVCDAAEGGLTVLGCKAAVNDVLATAKPSAGRNAKQPARKAADALAKVLDAAGKAGARKDAVESAVRASKLTVADIITAVGASDAARKLVIGSAGPEDIASLAREWASAREFSRVKALYLALREQIGKLRAKRLRRQPVPA